MARGEVQKINRSNLARISSHLAVVILFVINSGCASVMGHNHRPKNDTGVYSGNEHVKEPDSSILPNNENLSRLNAEANVLSDGWNQARAIFTLFEHHLRPDCSAAEVHRVLTDTRWLKVEDITKVDWIMGFTPVGLSGDRTVYDLHLFSTKEVAETNHWIIEFALTGADRNAQDGFAFLRGDSTLSRNPKMEEFALIFPPPSTLHSWPGRRIEVFSERGVLVYPE